MKKILGAIIIIVLFITGLFLFSQNQNLKQEIDVLNQKINELQTVKPEPAAEKILEGWKEYVDDEYKFRIWYPEEFTAYGETAEVRIVNFTELNGAIGKNFHMSLSSDSSVILLYIYIYNTSDDIKSFIKTDIERLIKNNVFDIEKYITVKKLNNIDLYKVEIPNKIIRYYTKNNMNIFIFEGEMITELKGNLLLTFDQMVHSFKFIE